MQNGFIADGVDKAELTRALNKEWPDSLGVGVLPVGSSSWEPY